MKGWDGGGGGDVLTSYTMLEFVFSYIALSSVLALMVALSHAVIMRLVRCVLLCSILFIYFNV